MQAILVDAARVQAYEPEAMNECKRLYGQRDDLVPIGTAEAALHNADASIAVTEWQQFRSPDYDVIKQCLKKPVILDGRNIYSPVRLRSRGITTYSIGR